MKVIWVKSKVAVFFFSIRTENLRAKIYFIRENRATRERERLSKSAVARAHQGQGPLLKSNTLEVPKRRNRKKIHQSQREHQGNLILTFPFDRTIILSRAPCMF